MRIMLMIAGLAVAVAAPSAAGARTYCDQYAHNRKVTGTVVGALAGGVLGNVVAGHGARTEGTVLGAGVGAAVGNNVARVKCDRGSAYYRSSYRSRTASARRPTARAPTYAAAGPYQTASYACRYETRAFYDERGRLVQAPVRVCN
jgi:uncharacterized protein YcfJ